MRYSGEEILGSGGKEEGWELEDRQGAGPGAWRFSYKTYPDPHIKKHNGLITDGAHWTGDYRTVGPVLDFESKE